MSVGGAMLAGFRQALKGLMLPEICTRQPAASAWLTSSGCRCLVEEASASAGGALDYEPGNGYGYSVFVAHDQELETTDRIIASVGTIEIVRVSPTATLDGVRRADGVLR